MTTTNIKSNVKVDNEAMVVEWLVKHLQSCKDAEDFKDHTAENYSCTSYQYYSKEIEDETLHLPEWAKQYFDTSSYVWDTYNLCDARGEGAFYLVYKDDETTSLVENVGNIFPAWKGKEKEFFTEHFDKQRFFIVRHTG